MNNYNVLLNNKIVGYAEIITSGLYLHIKARCKDIPKDFYRLYFHTASNVIDLGLCLYENSYYMWDKMIPFKDVVAGDIRFELKSSHMLDPDFIVIDPETRFACFTHIQNCYFQEKHGIKGIRINLISQNAPDSSSLHL